MRRGWMLVPALLVFRVCAGEPCQSTHPPVDDGTYAIRFCHGACTGAHAAFRTGKLGLLDRPLRDAQGRMWHKWLERGFINGCLSLDQLHGSPPGLATSPPIYTGFSWSGRWIRTGARFTSSSIARRMAATVSTSA